MENNVNVHFALGCKLNFETWKFCPAFSTLPRITHLMTFRCFESHRQKETSQRRKLEKLKTAEKKIIYSISKFEWFDGRKKKPVSVELNSIIFFFLVALHLLSSFALLPSINSTRPGLSPSSFTSSSSSIVSLVRSFRLFILAEKETFLKLKLDSSQSTYYLFLIRSSHIEKHDNFFAFEETFKAKRIELWRMEWWSYIVLSRE